MDAATINAKIYAGRGKAAIRIGTDHDFYRPSGSGDPLATSYGLTKVALNSGDNIYRKPNLYGHPTWFADFDASDAEVGDYLVSSCGTYFIAAKQSLLPIVAVECNASVRITRAKAPTGVGAVGYSGLCDSDDGSDDVIGARDPAASWPCSMLIGKGNERNKATLPADMASQPGWIFLLPASVPGDIRLGDRIFDDKNRICMVVQAESTDMGWRVVTSEVHP